MNPTALQIRTTNVDPLTKKTKLPSNLKCKRNHLYMEKPIVWAWSKTFLKMISRWGSIQTNYTQYTIITTISKKNTCYFIFPIQRDFMLMQENIKNKGKKDEKKYSYWYQRLDPLHFSLESDQRDANCNQSAVCCSNQPLFSTNLRRW